MSVSNVDLQIAFIERSPGAIQTLSFDTASEFPAGFGVSLHFPVGYNVRWHDNQWLYHRRVWVDSPRD